MSTGNNSPLSRLLEVISSGGTWNFLIPFPIVVIGVPVAAQAWKANGLVGAALVVIPLSTVLYFLFRHWRRRRQDWFAEKRAEISRKLGSETWLKNAQTPEQYLIAAIATFCDLHWCFHGVWLFAPSVRQDTPPTPESLAPLMKRAYEESKLHDKLESFEQFLLAQIAMIIGASMVERGDLAENAIAGFVRTYEEFKDGCTNP